MNYEKILKLVTLLKSIWIMTNYQLTLLGTDYDDKMSYVVADMRI